MDSSAPVASTVAADGSRRKSMMEKLTDSFRMTDQEANFFPCDEAKEEPISGRTRAREASAEGLSSAETNLSSWRRAIMASREQHNAMEDAWPYTSTPMSEAAIPVAAPTLAKAPTPVESAMKADESTPMEGGSPVERRWIIDTPSHSEEPFGVNFHSPVKEFVQPPSASPITSLPPPRITFQRATEDTEAREGFSAATGAESFNATEDVEHRESIPAATMAETLNATENMERREGVPADNLAETLNGLPGTSHPADVTNVLPEPVEGEPAPVLPPLKRRKLYLRKARNLAMRKTILQAMLGRQLADQTKPALRMLAHGERVLPTGSSVLDAAVVP